MILIITIMPNETRFFSVPYLRMRININKLEFRRQKAPRKTTMTIEHPKHDHPNHEHGPDCGHTAIRA